MQVAAPSQRHNLSNVDVHDIARALKTVHTYVNGCANGVNKLEVRCASRQQQHNRCPLTMLATHVLTGRREEGLNVPEGLTDYKTYSQ